MGCKNTCKLCDRLIISTAVTFTAPNLVITIPEGAYNDGEKYYIVIAQAIPDATTINAPVVVQIGAGTELYPLNTCNCAQVTAGAVRTRTKYATVVRTSATSGVFRLLDKICNRTNSLPSIDGTAPTA